MTLALYGKSRQRQQALLFFGLIAIIVAALAGASIWSNKGADAAFFAAIDDGGANDVPGDGQKDLTRLTVDDAGLPTTLATTWNWDETSVTGSNSMDACSLYDTDSDGNANFAVCAIVQFGPTVTTTVTHTCSDSEPDRCSAPNSIVPAASSVCSVAVSGDDPFPTGDEFPNDLKATCNVVLADVGAPNAVLLNVCSYPSASPTSSPNDCVLVPGTRTIRVVKVAGTAVHPGGTFTGTISPGLDTSFSVTLAANGSVSSADSNTVSQALQTVTETTLPANWTNAGYFVAQDTAAAPYTCTGNETYTNVGGSATVPAGIASFTVCIKNTYTAVAATGNLIIGKVRNPDGAAADSTTFSGTITGGGGATWSNLGFDQFTTPISLLAGEQLTVDENAPANGWSEFGYAAGTVGTPNTCPPSAASYTGTNIGVNLLPGQTQVVCVMNFKAAPSVSVTKTATANAYNLGASFDWTITATVSNGPTTSALILWDDVPSQFTVNSVTETDTSITCTLVLDPVDCVLDIGAATGAHTITVNVTVNANATCAAVTNYVRDGQSNTANILAQDEVTITGCGGITMAKADSTTLVDNGANIQWVIELHNGSVIPMPAYILDANATLVSSTGCTATQPGGAGGVITCNVPADNGGASPEATVTVKTPFTTRSQQEICEGGTRTNTAFLVDSDTDTDTTGDPSDSGTFTFPGTADAGCITLSKADGQANGSVSWTITFVNTGPAATVDLSDTYQPGTTLTSITSDGGLVCDVETGTTLLGCDLLLNSSSTSGGITTVTITTSRPTGTCELQRVSNTVSATFNGTPLNATAGLDLTGTYEEPANPALCTRNLRVVKVSGDTHPGGTFGGAITPGGADAANDSWSQSLAANGTASAGETNVVSLDAQTVTETTLPAGWVSAGYFIAPDTEQACSTSLSDYTTTNTVPQGSGDYLVCVRNAYVTIDKVSADVNGSSEPYAPGEEFHWDISVTIAGGQLKTALQISDTWDASAVNLVSIEPGDPFDGCQEGPTGTVTCDFASGTNPGTYVLGLHMAVGSLAGCGTTTNNVAILDGQTELDTDSDDVPLDCRRTIQLCKAWRLDVAGELADPTAANFSFNVSDSEEAPPGELVNIGGVQEAGAIECILMDVRFGTVTISEVPNAGFALDGWNFLQGDAPDGSFPTDATDDPATLIITPTACFAQSQAALAAVLNLVASIQAVVIPATGTTPLCTITFVNHDLQNRLPTGDLRIEKYRDINGDGDANDSGEGLIPWDVTISGPDPAVDGEHSLVGGTITFSGLETGDVYTVTEDTQTGWTVTNTTVDGVTIGASTVAGTSIPNGGTTVIRFYNQQRGSISVHKEAQISHNGNVSAATNDDDGWTFTAVSVDCGINHVGVTDANGNFTFSGLPMCDDYVVTEQTPNALSPGFVPVGPSSFSNQTPNGQTLTVLNRRTTSDPPCQNCTPTTPTTTPVTPPATPTTPTTPTATPTTPPATPTTPVTQIAGEKTPGPATPVAPSTGSSVLSASGAGLNILLLLVGLVALSGGLGVLALGRRTHR